MKATNNITGTILKSLIIIVSIFFIQISNVFAEIKNCTPPAVPAINTLIQALAPVNPGICDFNDAELNTADFSDLAPVTPSEADFNDTPEVVYDPTGLALLSPAEADFNDAVNHNITDLAPLTPSEAGFID
jgi:hypothetical protein